MLEAFRTLETSQSYKSLLNFTTHFMKKQKFRIYQSKTTVFRTLEIVEIKKSKQVENSNVYRSLQLFEIKKLHILELIK